MSLSISSLIASIRKDHPANESLRLDLGDLSVEVRTNSSALRDKLSRYFKEFLSFELGSSADILITAHETGVPDFGIEYSVKKPDPGKTKIKEEWVDCEDGRIVRKRLTGMHFLFGKEGNVAVGPCLANDNQVVNFVNNRFIEYKLNKGCLLGHAAGVIHNGRGIAMAGFSGMGKSTLALHLMSKGTVFVSNDRVMVDKADDGLVFFGVPKHPRINPGTALNNDDLACIIEPEDKDKFLSLPPDELWNLEHKYDAIVEECFGEERFVLQAPLNALVILNWKRDNSPTSVSVVNPAERQDLLPAFMKGTGLFYRPDAGDDYSDPDIHAYTALLSQTTIIEISGGVDFDKAAAACLSFMETGKL